MKISLISPSRASLETMKETLQARTHTVSLHEGGKTRMRAVADAERPDLIIVEGMCCDPSELDYVDQLTTQYPAIAVILLCATNTHEFLINSMRSGVREVLPSPPGSLPLIAAVDRVDAKLRGGATRARGQVLAFVGCKGGSGATFIATNLGAHLAESKRVLLIDLNLQYGDALYFVHDARPSLTLANLAHEIERLDASFLEANCVPVSPTFHVLAAPEDPSQATEIKAEHIDAILSVAVTHYDFVLLDVSRMTDAITIKALDRADRIFPVLQAALPFLRNTHKVLAVFASLGYPLLKVTPVVNRFEARGEISLEMIRRSLAFDVVHTVPNSYKEVSTSINEGNALGGATRSGAVTRSLGTLASSLSPSVQSESGILRKFFKRA